MVTPYRIERSRAEKYAQRKPPTRIVEAMREWGLRMSEEEMVPYVEGYGWAGNMGCREGEVIWVTSSGCPIKNISLESVIGISQEQDNIVFFGKEDKRPTSEWEIYWALFHKRKEVQVIFHGHDQVTLSVAEKLVREYPALVALTPNKTPSGSPEFREEILSITTNSNRYLIGNGHGFFALGPSFEETGALALRFRKIAATMIRDDAL